jgi:PUA domain protein
LIVVNTEIVFFNERDGPYFPTLRLLHKCNCCSRLLILTFVADPDILPKVQVDRGAIKFVMSGANIMCPGLTSKGGKLPDVDMPKDSIVVFLIDESFSNLA